MQTNLFVEQVRQSKIVCIGNTAVAEWPERAAFSASSPPSLQDLSRTRVICRCN